MNDYDTKIKENIVKCWSASKLRISKKKKKKRKEKKKKKENLTMFPQIFDILMDKNLNQVNKLFQYLFRQSTQVFQQKYGC